MRLIWRLRPRGFSLIELLAAAAILGLLASVAIPFVETTVRRQKEQALRTALDQIRTAIDAYKQAVVDQRIEINEGRSGYPATLQDLVSGVPDKKNGNRPLYFLRRIPADPFAPVANVNAAATWGVRSFSSSADNPQPGEDVFDVYSTSVQSGLNGVPYREW